MAEGKHDNEWLDPCKCENYNLFFLPILSVRIKSPLIVLTKVSKVVITFVHYVQSVGEIQTIKSHRDVDRKPSSISIYMEIVNLAG